MGFVQNRVAGDTQHASVALRRRRSRGTGFGVATMARARRRRDHRRRHHRPVDCVSPCGDRRARCGARDARDRTRRLGPRVRPARALSQAQPPQDRRGLRPWARSVALRCGCGRTGGDRGLHRTPPDRLRGDAQRHPDRRQNRGRPALAGGDRRAAARRADAVWRGRGADRRERFLHGGASRPARPARRPARLCARARARRQGARRADPSANARRSGRAQRIGLGAPLRRPPADGRQHRHRHQCVFGRAVAEARTQHRAVPGARLPSPSRCPTKRSRASSRTGSR